MRFTTRIILVTWVALLSLAGTDVWGQVTISFPTNRTVLQRDKNNSATIYIRGTYSRPIDRVDIQLRAVNGGATSDWITIQNNPQGGSFSGQVDWTGGWYEMEVRGLRENQIVGSSTLHRLGIGEVFLISGQSNAQGYFNYGGPGANDDRVNCVNYYNGNSISELPNPEFVHLNSDSYLSPRGNSAWAWGRLGDQLAARLGVPILFYNTGWYGTAARNWRQSINGTAYSVYNGEAFVPKGMPYGNMRLALQYYVPLTGVRAVLWLQGEADNFANTSSTQYREDLKAVIDQSRAETGRNLSWVIARCSYDNQRGVDFEVIKGQNEVVASHPNTFYGPETDNIQRPRLDGAHFQSGGLYELGDAWNTWLNDDFFARSEPSKSTPPPTIRVACAGDNLSLTIEGNNYSSINWNNGQNSANIHARGGRYFAKVRDAQGNIFVSPEIVVPDQVQPAAPRISIDGQNTLCQGSSVALTASTDENIRWNTGQTEQRITTGSANTFSVTTTNVYGCQSTSDPLTITVFDAPPPPKPSVTVQGATTFCVGETVTLQSNSAVRSVWSNGQEGASITIGNTGDFRVKAIDQNGCSSPESDPVAVRVNPLPAKPLITASRSTTFCAGEEVTLTSSYSNGNLWRGIESSRSNVTISTSGEYAVTVTDHNGCTSVSEPVRVQVNPLPPTPTIKALRPTTFCQRDYTVLQASASNSYQWNTGSTQRDIEIRASGEYSLTTTDANGCRSIPSEPIRVVVNPLPPKPSIQYTGSTTFCADQTLTLRAPSAKAYAWSNGATTQQITTNQANTYHVQVLNEFGCVSDVSDRVTLQVLPLPATPSVTASGPTTFCQGDKVDLIVNGSGNFFWNTGATGKKITIEESGNYSVRDLGANGCFSLYSSPMLLEAKPAPESPTITQVGTYTLEAINNLQDDIYIWKRDGIELPQTSPFIKATQPGLYVAKAIVQYSPSLRCISGESSVFRFIPDLTSTGLSIYPNPSADGRVNLETVQDLDKTMLTIIDLKGEIIRTFTLPSLSERVQIDVSALADGVYVIQVNSAGFKAAQKLVINH